MSKKNDGKRQCPDCNKWFVDLNNHKKCDGRGQTASQRSPDDKLQCPDCNKWFVDLNNHKKCDGRGQTASQRSPDDKQQCPDCNKWFVDLNNHKKCDGRGQRASQRSPDDKQQCPDCNKWFVDLNNHKKCNGRGQTASQRSPDDKQQCPDCNKWFVDLNNHKKCNGRGQTASQRSPDDKQQCPDCNKWFVDLNNHKKCDGRGQRASQRSPDDKQQCPDCNKWFVDLNNHKKCDGRGQTASQRSPDGKQQCPDCNKWFVDLNNHKKCDGRGQRASQRSPDGKQQCPDCNKWFVDLNNHKKCDGRGQRASQRSPDDKQQCPDCNKWLVDLNNHKKCDGRGQTASQRSPDDKQQCPDCNKWFVDLNNHKKCDGRSRPRMSPCVNSTPLGSGNPTTGQHIAHSNEMDRDVVTKMEEFVGHMVSTCKLEHSRNPRSDILNFFNDDVALKQTEIVDVAPYFTELQNDICTFLKSKTPWTWKVFRGGSYYDKTKVSRPNEMDCLFIPEVDSPLQPVYRDCYPGYCKVRVENTSSALNSLCKDSFLNPGEYRQYFFDRMDEFVRGSPRCKRNLKHQNSPSFGITYTGTTTFHGTLDIDVDIVPAINIPQWPPSSTARDLSKCENLKEISHFINLSDIKEKGFNITTKCCPAHHADNQWQMSFSLAENKLTLHGNKDSWKPILRTMKRVMEIAKGQQGLTVTGKSQMIQQVAEHTKQHYLRDASFRLCFTTYHIRTLMWTLLYDLSAGFHVWEDETQEHRLHFCLGKFKKMLTGEMTVPHFFLPNVRNMMSTVRWKDREFMYILVRSMEILFSRVTDQYS
ncbi:uncharacterized protein LOC124262089 isoform X2 [Haliotis rubra]|uniref:uncharacterized protein LOC124262089 isoform X2 n=1 Tax=Haliotis rubra TaxID=36100 RepID=UPI001EE56C84|nr:uncharacterized protein LOC124262089 isoform X2 [Haliotis rubra]